MQATRAPYEYEETFCILYQLKKKKIKIPYTIFGIIGPLNSLTLKVILLCFIRLEVVVHWCSVIEISEKFRKIYRKTPALEKVFQA